MAEVVHPDALQSGSLSRRLEVLSHLVGRRWSTNRVEREYGIVIRRAIATLLELAESGSKLRSHRDRSGLAGLDASSLATLPRVLCPDDVGLEVNRPPYEPLGLTGKAESA